MSLHALGNQWLRYAAYRTGVARHLRRALPFGRHQHETPRYWNDELSGRMSRPNRNGRISNALRDATSVLLLKECAKSLGRVLDIGCGFGNLGRTLAREGARHYTGVDLSDYVIDNASRQASQWAESGRCEFRFCNSDLRAFTPEPTERFDVIVFNEVLKYLEVETATEQVLRYGAWLNPGGVICVSITEDPKSDEIFSSLAQRLQWVYGTLYQQRPDRPKFRITLNAATPAYLVGIFRCIGRDEVHGER